MEHILQNYYNICYPVFQKQNMSQQELQQKLQQVNKKLKIICQSYLNLKAQLQSKEQYIAQLQMQIARLNQNEQTKQNNRVQDIRKKYQMQSVFKPTDRTVQRVAHSSNEARMLTQAKSLSPKKFKRTQASTQALPQQQYIKYQPKYEPISKSFTASSIAPSQVVSRPPIIPSHVSQSSALSSGLIKHSLTQLPPDMEIKVNADLEKERNKYQLKLKEIDKQYGTDLGNHNKDTKDTTIFTTDINKTSHHPKNNHNTQVIHSQNENQMLKQIWEQRDKEIQRMDQLFQNLNKRIYGTQ